MPTLSCIDGLMAAADQLRERLARQPVTGAICDAAGKDTQVVLGLDDFQGDLLGRARDHARWPAFVLALYQAIAAVR